MKEGDKVIIVDRQARKEYPQFVGIEGIITRIGVGILPITVDFGVVLESTKESVGYFTETELEVVK